MVEDQGSVKMKTLKCRMKQELLSVINEYPEFIELADEISVIEKLHKEKMAFLNKQAKDLSDESHGKIKEIYRKLETFLQSRGKLPEDYNESIHGELLIAKEMNAIWLQKHCGTPETCPLRPFTEMFQNE